MKKDPSTCKLQLGDLAPYFSLQATDGKIYSINDFQTASALAIIFTSNHCPIARAYERRIIEVAKLAKEVGAQVLCVCSNDSRSYPADSFEKMQEKSQESEFAYPYLHDKTQVVAKAYDAKLTPESYLFDDNLKLKYHGSIDDEIDESFVEVHYLRDALQRVSEGLDPEHQESMVLGCSIKWKL